VKVLQQGVGQERGVRDACDGGRGDGGDGVPL
jgi:hypothetical protein